MLFWNLFGSVAAWIVAFVIAGLVLARLLGGKSK